MALISLRQLLDHAAEHGCDVPALDVNDMLERVFRRHRSGELDPRLH